MTSYTISPIWGAGAQLFDNSGNVLSGGKIYTYYAGSTTPLTTYTNPIGTVANSNPIIANAAGRLTNEIWFPVSGAYKFVLKDANDVLLATYDNIPTTPQPPIVNDASSISYQQGYEVDAGNFTIGATYLITTVGTTDFVAIGAAANVTGIHFTATGVGSGTGKAEFSRTVEARLQDVIDVKDFGAVGDGVANDAIAINAAITAAIAAGGGTVYFPAGKYKCTTRIGTFVNAENISLIGYGAEIQNYAGVNIHGLIEFGDATTNGYVLYTATTTTVNNLTILGIKFTSSNGFTTKWADQLPLSINTAKNVLIKDCYFENWDFAAINFGALCKDGLVDSCTFYSSEVDAGHSNYGVRIFCYGTTTNYQNGNGDLNPTDAATGILKTGYALIPETNVDWGHENINVTNCYFENVSHGVMVSAARRGIVSGNNFVNCSTRSVSLTTYSTDYSCNSNTYSLDTNQQTSTGVSTFYGIGQATYRHKIDNEQFIVIGAVNNATGFTPVKCYFNSHAWTISNCSFYLPTFSSSSGARCINTDDNSDGYILNNTFNCPNIVSPISLLPAYTVTAPAYQQGPIWIIGNVFSQYSTGAIQILNTTSAPETIIIKNNIDYGSGATRFIACGANASNKVCRLWLEGNDFVNGGGVYYIQNTTANKAIIRNYDILTVTTLLSTGGGVATPSTTAVSFDYTSRGLATFYKTGTKLLSFTAYGGRENGQDGTGFSFVVTSETSETIAGNIVRTGGASFEYGYVALNIQYIPLVS